MIPESPVQTGWMSNPAQQDFMNPKQPLQTGGWGSVSSHPDLRQSSSRVSFEQPAQFGGNPVSKWG